MVYLLRYEIFLTDSKGLSAGPAGWRDRVNAADDGRQNFVTNDPPTAQINFSISVAFMGDLFTG